MKPGQTLGPYRIVEPLGSGGMGEVYQAEDTRLDRMVALKVLPQEFSDDAERLGRFEREARTIAALEHPSVVTIHSVEEIEGVRFLTMELIRGRTLADELRGGDLPLERMLAIAVPLAEGVTAAHAAGIVHRDLKPANVMITDDGRVKVLDFGLAKARFDAADPDASRLPTEAATEEGRILGTAGYMAPEQVKGKPADERSDIFAVGVILYEMVTGVRPFRGGTWAEISTSILRESPAPVTELNRDLPTHLGRIVRRCLEKDPGRRYQSALDLRNELDDLAREVALPRRSTDPRRSHARAADSWRSADPRPHPLEGTWKRGLVAMGTLALLSLVWMGWTSWRGTTPSAETPAASIRSIAVLAFDSAGSDTEDRFLVEGMQDALITELSKTDLLVIGQGSMLRFGDSDLTPPEIAEGLGVVGLVEGSVLRVGDRVRVSARLVHGPTNRYLWAESYDRGFDDILVLTAELARAIADEVQIAITPDQERRLAGARRVEPAAWEAYSRGLYHNNRFTPRDFELARQFFQEAIDIEPEFAAAWAGLGFAYGAPASTSGRPDPELVAGAWRALDRALELDPGLADAHAALGHGRLALDWNWAAAERELLLALELKPNSTLARHGYGDLLVVQGHVDESVEQMRIARQYDPLSPLTSVTLVAHLVLARRYDEAIAEYRDAMERIPELSPHFSWVADAHWDAGRREEAVQEYAAAWRDRGSEELAAALRDGFESDGVRGAARAVAERLAASGSTDDQAVSIATWYARAGDAAATLDWLERAYEVHIPTLPILLRRTEFDLVRLEPRYATLVERLDMPR